MQNSNVLEKSRGILAFAVNTTATDYVQIANQTLGLASQVLDLPYTLVSEEQIKDYIDRSNRYDVDCASFVEWKNMGRQQAYDLSPYDETLVIDVDYIVQDRSLLKYFDLPWDYLLTRSALSLNQESFATTMGAMSLPYVWATVFMFRKTARAQQFFNLVNRIQRNYHYYRDLYNIESRTFRNDYAFSLADTILNGFSLQTESLPRLLNVTQSVDNIELVNNQLVLRDPDRAYVIPRTNLHLLGKKFLQSSKFEKFIETCYESA